MLYSGCVVFKINGDVACSADVGGHKPIGIQNSSKVLDMSGRFDGKSRRNRTNRIACPKVNGKRLPRSRSGN